MKPSLLVALVLALILTGFAHDGLVAEYKAIHENFKAVWK